MVTAVGTTPPRLVLVVDDEANLLAAIRYVLEHEGFRVVTAERGDEALRAAQDQRPDLVLLDVMLPRLDGFEICRVIRAQSSVPILMLTAKDSEQDKVRGLELGADDYLTKPFSMRELLARVRAMLRRAEMAGAAARPPDVAQFDNLEVDFERQEVRRGGRPVGLKPRELQLLLFLARHPGRPFTREQLLERVWGYDFAGGSRTVDVHVRWLREKIEEDPASPRFLLTVRGLGYRFEG